MPDWQEVATRLKTQAAKVPKVLWITGAVAAASLTVVMWLAFSAPPYSVLSDGLSPSAGGKVIAELQKLGIPYQLQEAGNVILVPASQLAQARLQLGASQIPGSSSQTAWNQLENAPITTSDLAQSTMASQALELSLEQSIEAMNGIRNAQVFLAQPPETPFLADQPKPTASVVIEADQNQAASLAPAIAAMVAGAVPGLGTGDVTVVTTSGITVYPTSGGMNAGSQFAIIQKVENAAAARVAELLTPLVGPGNFRTNVSADMDFTQTQIHQISYGPNHFVQNSNNSESSQMGAASASYGIPGALSNEPPGPTTTTPDNNTASNPDDNTNANNTPQTNKANAATEKTTEQTKNKTLKPTRTSDDLQQRFVTDQTNSNIVKPGWAVKSIAISVVLNEKSLPEGLTAVQIKNAIASGFAYPNVNVNILSTPFNKTNIASYAAPSWVSLNPLVHALLELFVALALLFGLALPIGRRLATLNFKTLLPPSSSPDRHPVPVTTKTRDFTDIRRHASENISGVTRLLQNWVDDHDQ